MIIYVVLIFAMRTCIDFWRATSLSTFLVAGRGGKAWISYRPIHSVLLAHTKLQQNVGHKN
jgi:hypothetical protein